ncbi:MAG: polysaccharide deacetylase family protein [Singulisphaera sp.]|nr:polysaccharide deacetylase family protein [Singulisphaera sp.]
MLREMKRAGMWIGGHTASHPILARLSRPLQDAEIAECRRRIAAELREPMTRFFSYPNGGPGDFNDDTRSCLADHGVEFAFSYYGGFRRFDDWDPYDIRRVGVEKEMTLDQFRAVTTLPQVFSR